MASTPRPSPSPTQADRLAGVRAAGSGSGGGGWGGGGGAVRPETQLPLGRYTVDENGNVAVAKPGGLRVSGRRLSAGQLRRANAGDPVRLPGQHGDGYTAEDVSNILRRMPPEKLAQVQRQMVAAGMLPDDFRSFNYVDPETQKKFLDLLEMSNTAEQTWESTLRSLAVGEVSTQELRKEQARRQAMLGWSTQVSEFRQTDPASLRETAQAAFQKMLGRDPRPDEMDRFVDGFLAEERAQWERGENIADEEVLAGRRRSLMAADLQAGGTGGGVEAFMNALAIQESSGNAAAMNDRTGAHGTFQILPGNWAGWAKEAGLPANAPRTPENQERVARYKLEQYHQQFGSWDAVAVAWYAGPDDAARYVKNPNDPKFSRRPRKNEPSIKEYVSSVTGRMGGAAADPSLPGDAAGGGTEAQRLRAALQRMVADSPHPIELGKETRSYEEQVAAWRRYQAGGPKAAKPGTSKHGDGRANDLQYGNDAARQWALENAHKYGIHFPIYNPGLKRSHDESWHAELMDDTGISHTAAPPVSRRVTTVDIDPTARAREQAIRDNPQEAGAYGIGKQFDSFLQILSQGVGL